MIFSGVLVKQALRPFNSPIAISSLHANDNRKPIAFERDAVTTFEVLRER
jgi:hypothetical protein